MNKEREISMLIAAKLLANEPFDKLREEDLETMLKHGNITGAVICGVRWADQNPESPWIHVGKRLPEDSLPNLSDKERRKVSIRCILRMKSERIMQGERRMNNDGIWYWNIPMYMREEIVCWMSVPALPKIDNN